MTPFFIEVVRKLCKAVMHFVLLSFKIKVEEMGKTAFRLQLFRLLTFRLRRFAYYDVSPT